jgi:hypothetical protein
MAKLISLRKFAKVVGVSHTAVGNAIKAGRLVRAVVLGADGKVSGIDPELGVEEWSENSPSPVSQKTKDLNDEDLPLPAGLSYADARAVRENYQARLAKLLYEEKMGRLVDSETVEKQAFEAGRLVRQAVLTVPDRYGHELAAETEVNRFVERLTKALVEALEQAAHGNDPGTTDPTA